MKTLLILRHGKSSWKHPGLADHDRPLNGRGRRDAPQVGRLLREKGLVPDLIVSSTAIRARVTAELVADRAGCSRRAKKNRDLYLASVPDILGVLRKVGGRASRLLVVGHNPGLEELIAGLTGCDVMLPTAALVEVRLEVDKWSKLDANTRGRLVNLWRPRQLADGE